MLYSANKPSVITTDFILQLVLNTAKPREKFIPYFVFVSYLSSDSETFWYGL